MRACGEIGVSTCRAKRCGLAARRNTVAIDIICRKALGSTKGSLVMHRLRGAAMLLVVTAAANTTKTPNQEPRGRRRGRHEGLSQAVRPGEDKGGRSTNCKRHLFRTEQGGENLGKILILNGKVFANRHEGKVYGHLVNTARALMEKNDVGNLAYLHESGASGRCATNKDGKKITDLPSTLIARDGYSSNRCGVLVPNPYFGNLDHRQREDDRLLRAAALNEYDARTPRAFWRGHLRQMRSVIQRRACCTTRTRSLGRCTASASARTATSRASRVFC